MRKHTYRQYLTWMAWLEEQWNNPGRLEWYLMQIACEVRMRGSKERQRDPSKMKIRFVRKKQAKSAPSVDPKAIWCARVMPRKRAAIKPQVKEPPPAGKQRRSKKLRDRG